MGKKLLGLEGQVFGKLTVVEMVEGEGKGTRYLCRCSCDENTEKIVYAKQLKSGNTKSCGCLKLEVLNKRNDNRIGENKIIEYESYLEIYPNNNQNPFLIDLEDYSKFLTLNRTWWINSTGYVVCKYKGKIVKLHNYIMEPSVGYMVDHINGNALDNRRNNLRICSLADNSKNRSIPSNNTSGVKGVWWDNTWSKWVAVIGSDGKQIRLGSFTDFNEAVKVRKEAEVKYHGAYIREEKYINIKYNNAIR